MNITAILNKTFPRFLLVGIINTIVAGVLLFSLYNVANFTYWISSVITHCVICVLAFFLNRRFTFQVKYWSVFMAVSYILMTAFSFFIAYGIARPAMNYLLENRSKDIRENIALLTGMILFTGINYFAQKYIVFNRKK